MKRFVIDLATLPEEGKTYSGEIDPEIFEFSERDQAKPKTPLEFELFAQRFESELLLQGSLRVEIDFSCARCLNTVTVPVSLPTAAISLEITEEGKIDTSDAIREEIVIELPNYPKCEDAEPPQECFVDLKYFAVDKTEEDSVKTPPRREVASEWSALDALPELPSDSSDSQE